MPVYQIIIEVDHQTNANEVIDHVEYIESRLLVEAANEADKHATAMEGELKSIRYATPTPIKI